MAGHSAETVVATQKFINGNALFFRYFADFAVHNSLEIIYIIDISEPSILTGAWFKGPDIRFWKTEQNL